MKTTMQFDADAMIPPPNKKEMEIGQTLWARWDDKLWYPGHILGVDLENKCYTVNFFWEKPGAGPDAVEEEEDEDGRTFKDKPVMDWTVEDVGDWLDSIRFGQYRELFEERGIDGPKLL